MGGSQNALFQPIPFPAPINALVAAPVAAPGLPQLSINAADPPRLNATKGIFFGAQVAAAHHRTLNPVDPPSLDELLSRVPAQLPTSEIIKKLQEDLSEVLTAFGMHIGDHMADISLSKPSRLSPEQRLRL